MELALGAMIDACRAPGPYTLEIGELTSSHCNSVFGREARTVFLAWYCELCTIHFQEPSPSGSGLPDALKSVGCSYVSLSGVSNGSGFLLRHLILL